MFGRPELIGDRGAIAATHWLATGAGAAVLEQGGNAVDAAVAAGLVLQVVEPHSNGLGGDVSIVFYCAATGETKVICGQGGLPQKATIGLFRSAGLGQIPGSGMLPACVPGAFGGWLRLLAEYGTRPLRPLAEPAIGYADRGYPLPADAARAIAVLAPLFEREWAGSGEIYLKSGTAPAAGTRIANPALAATMRRIVREAEQASGSREAQLDAADAAFYKGFVAESIDEFVRAHSVLDATGRRHRGLLTADDMAAFAASIEQPASLDYQDYAVHKPGPWSQGPVFLQQLALLDGFDLPSLGLGSGAYLHLVIEAAKLAFADREAWYGDPDYQHVPLGTLLSPEYSRSRRALITDQASPDPQPGQPEGRRSFMPVPEPDRPEVIDSEWLAQLQSGMPNVVLAATARSGDTCAVAVADRWGNLVAAVPSGGWLKSSPVIPGLGFPLGTRAQSMWLTEGHPNSAAPGKRPRSTLSPTVVLRDGQPYLAFGTPGGDRQDQWTLESFLAVTQFGLDLQSATEVPTFHTDHFPASFTPRACRPGVVAMEDAYDPDVLVELRRRGHRVEAVPRHSMGGRVCIVGRSGDGFLRAGAGPRGRQAYAICR